LLPPPCRPFHWSKPRCLSRPFSSLSNWTMASPTLPPRCWCFLQCWLTLGESCCIDIASILWVDRLKFHTFSATFTRWLVVIGTSSYLLPRLLPSRHPYLIMLPRLVWLIYPLVVWLSCPDRYTTICIHFHNLSPTNSIPTSLHCHLNKCICIFTQTEANTRKEFNAFEHIYTCKDEIIQIKSH
jgi:hypothetical protein